MLDKIKGSDYNNICSLMKIIQAKLSGSGSVVEHRLAKARVASSNLVFRSILFFGTFNSFGCFFY